MTTPVSRLLVGSDAERQSVTDAGWLEWLSAHIDAGVAAGRMGRLAVAVHRRFGQRPDRGVAVPDSGLPDGGAGL